MKKTLLVLLIVLWPISAHATLISYTVSALIPAEDVGRGEFYGDVFATVQFKQDTESDPFRQQDILGQVSLRTVNGCCGGTSGGRLGSFENFINVVSSNEVFVNISDPSGFMHLDFFYNAALGLLPFAAPLPEPDFLTLSFGQEMQLCLPSMPCFIGTGGSHSFARGEFNFSVTESPAWLLLGLGSIIVGFQRRLS